MLREMKFAIDNYYHVYNRGTDKRTIFLENSNYLRFIILLHICNNNELTDIKNFFRKISQGRSLTLPTVIELLNKQSENNRQTLVDIGAYCLMPNHFHLLLKEKMDGGISLFMKKMGTAYAMYFNKKYERNGNLFQGRFKAELAQTDEYLKYLFAYIHLNPIKLLEPKWKEKEIKNIKKGIEFLNNYPWSSYLSYIKNQTNPILNSDAFPQYFDNAKEIEILTNEWFKYQTK